MITGRRADPAELASAPAGASASRDRRHDVRQRRLDSGQAGRFHHRRSLVWGADHRKSSTGPDKINDGSWKRISCPDFSR